MTPLLAQRHQMQNEASHALLERARSGDREALEELLTRHQAQVYRFGLKMCRNPEDAQDVLDMEEVRRSIDAEEPPAAGAAEAEVR